MKLIFIIKTLHLASLLQRGSKQLGNGLLKAIILSSFSIGLSFKLPTCAPAPSCSCGACSTVSVDPFSSSISVGGDLRSELSCCENTSSFSLMFELSTKQKNKT